LLVIIAIAVLVAAALGGYLFVKRRERREKIAAITSGADLLARWSYTPNEWEPVADEFSLGRSAGAGEVYISPAQIYIKGESKERLIDLASDGRVVTFASYRGAEGNPLKIRVRWKVTRRYEDRPDEVKYYKEDYRIPVPAKYADEAQQVAGFFTQRLEANLDAYTAVVSDDDPISLFGKDSF
jgi:hypothetical protein